jgi:hypothetical protein
MVKLPTDNIKRKNPVNRNNLFFSEEQMNFQIGVGMEYVNRFVNQTVVLYEVDMSKTNLNDVYAESDFKNIMFKTPVELNVIYKLDKHELKAYDKTTIKGYYAKVGKLEFGIYEKELKENDCDIKRGDYIGLQVTPDHMEFFTVIDDGRVNYDNAHTYFGLLPHFRSIKCAAVGDVQETVGV